MRRIAALATALLMGLGLVGCADSEDTVDTTSEAGEPPSQEPTTEEPSTEEPTAPEETESSEETPAPEEIEGEEPTGDDAELIEQTLVTWDLEGGCEHMTDKFLEEQTFLDERNAACEAYESLFVEKQYSADNIIISDVQVDGDRATALFGSDIAPDFTVTYELVKEDGAWLIDGAGF